MVTSPVLLLLLFDLLLFAVAAFYFDSSEQKWENLLLSALFLFSGMPALISKSSGSACCFHLRCERRIRGGGRQRLHAWFGSRSIAGGRLSLRFPRHGILIFAVAELGIAIFGLSSLHIFRWAATYSAGANLPPSILLASCSFSSDHLDGRNTAYPCRTSGFAGQAAWALPYRGSISLILWVQPSLAISAQRSCSANLVRPDRCRSPHA